MAAGMSCKHNKQCSCFVVIFFADIHIVINVGCFEYTFTNIDKAASNADFPKSDMLFFPPILDYHFISQPWKDCFQHWSIISFTILGNTGSNIGLSVHLPTLQRWFPILDFQFIYQHWTFFTFTNLGNAVSNDGFSLHLPTLEYYKITFQCW